MVVGEASTAINPVTPAHANTPNKTPVNLAADNNLTRNKHYLNTPHDLDRDRFCYN